MNLRAARHSAIERADEALVLAQPSIVDRPVEPHQILLDHAACTDREMPDLGVTHLAFGKTDGGTGRG